MARKKKLEEIEQEEVTTMDATILEVLEEMSDGDRERQPTLRAIAEALEVPAQRIYGVSRQPVKGKEYNPDEPNWDAIDRFVKRRLDPDKGLNTLEDVVQRALERMVELAATDGRRRSTGGVKRELILLPDGSTMPARKKTLEVGQRVMFRNDKPEIYMIMLVTESHVCVQLEGMPTLQAYGNWTLNQKLLTDEENFDTYMEERKAKVAKAAANRVELTSNGVPMASSVSADEDEAYGE